MDWVKDNMGLRFGCEKILLFHHKAPNSPLPLPLPTSTIHLHHIEKEASASLPFHQAVLLMEKVEDLEEFEAEKGFSECSSECQSGWTLYLCQSQDLSLTTSSPPSIREVSVHEDEEEDLSMLSDASSGPPHPTEEDCINFYYCSNDGDHGCLTTFARNGIGKRRKDDEENRKKQRRQKENSSFLDDTASSPLLCFSEATSSISSSCSTKRLLVEDVSELSCGFSANHFKKKAALRKVSLKKDMGNYLQLNQAPVRKLAINPLQIGRINLMAAQPHDSFSFSSYFCYNRAAGKKTRTIWFKERAACIDLQHPSMASFLIF